MDLLSWARASRMRTPAAWSERLFRKARLNQLIEDRDLQSSATSNLPPR